MSIRATYRWATFAALSLLFFLVSAGTFSSLGVVLPVMVKDLGWSWAQAGLGYAFLGVACGLSSLAPAVTVRLIGVRATVVLGATMLAIGFAALAMTHSAWVYLAATVDLGIAFSLVTIPGTYVLTGLFAQRSTVLGAYFTIGAMGGVAAPLLYVWIGPNAGWRAYWWMFVAAAFVLGVFGAATTSGKESVAVSPNAGSAPLDEEELIAWTVRRALATPQFYVIVGAYTMYLLINTTSHGFSVAHLT